MGIQRGDQVYYRGEVWTVIEVKPRADMRQHVTLERFRLEPVRQRVMTTDDHVQRVEQVR